jgi:hypothetical protein
MRSTPRGSLERPLPRPAPTEDELLAMWHKQGIVVIRLADVRDDIIRQAFISEASRLYGRRETT